MTSPELDNLVRNGHLKREAPSEAELNGLVRSGEARLTDAANDVREALRAAMKSA